MAVNAVSNNYVVYDSTGKSKVVSKDDEELVFKTGTNDKNNVADVDYACTDGKDDGKISFGAGVKSFFKGVGKTAINMVVGPFEALGKGNPVPLLLTGAAVAATAIIGAPAVVALGAVGVVTGGAQVISGISKAVNAETDGEAKAALEQTGGGVFTAGVSALAVKGGVKSMKSTLNKMGETSKMTEVSEQIKAGEIKGFGKLTKRIQAYGEDSRTIIASKKGTHFTKIQDKAIEAKERAVDAKAHKKFIKENGLKGEKILSQEEIDMLLKDPELTPEQIMQQHETQLGQEVSQIIEQEAAGKPATTGAKPVATTETPVAESKIPADIKQRFHQIVDDWSNGKITKQQHDEMLAQLRKDYQATKLSGSEVKPAATQTQTATAPKADVMPDYLLEEADGQLAFDLEKFSAPEAKPATQAKPAYKFDKQQRTFIEERGLQNEKILTQNEIDALINDLNSKQPASSVETTGDGFVYAQWVKSLPHYTRNADGTLTLVQM